MTSDIIETTVVQQVDFVAMVSAVGGSAGLFLGFSMVTCCLELYDLIMTCVFHDKEESIQPQTTKDPPSKAWIKPDEATER